MALRINAGYKDSVNVTFDDHFTDELSLYIRIKKDPVFKPDPYKNDARSAYKYRIFKKGNTNGTDDVFFKSPNS